MAVHKAIRSNPQAQPQPQHAKNTRTGGPKPARRRVNPYHLKPLLFETLHQFNRGFAVALSALDRLGGRNNKDRLQRPPQPAIFPRGCLANYRNRTEVLRALANRDLLRLFAGREEQDAERFGRLCGMPKPRRKRRS